MIRNIKKYIVSVAIALSAISCLDKYPEYAIPEKEAMATVAEANQVVIGIYAAFKSQALYSGYLTLLPDLQTDMGATPAMVCMQRLATSLAQIYCKEKDGLDLPLPALPLDLKQELD